MTDHLHPVLDDAAIARMTSLALAHVGDAVYEILVRTHLACGGTQTAKNLHSRTIQLVRASAQAEAVKRIQPMLDEDEQTVLRHGRNAKPKSVPKSASVAEYAYATHSRRCSAGCTSRDAMSVSMSCLRLSVKGLTRNEQREPRKRFSFCLQ